MKKFYLFFSVLFFTVFTILNAQNTIDINATGSRGLKSQESTNPAVREMFKNVERYRQFDFNTQLATLRAENVGDLLLLNFFDDKNYQAVIQRVEVNEDRTSIAAEILDNDFAFCYIVVSDTAISLSAEIPLENAYFFATTTNQQPYIAQMLQSDLEELPDSEAIVDAVKEIKEAKSEQVGGRGPNDDYDIHLLFVYTPKAATWAATNATSIDNVIDQAMLRANQAMSNSGAGVTFKVAYKYQTNYVETNTSDDFYRLKNPSDGYMDEVFEYRNAFCADIIVFLAEIGYTGGSGYLLEYLNGFYWDDTYAMNICRVQQTPNTYTMVHEIGHNMGAHHHYQQATQPGPNTGLPAPLNVCSSGWRGTVAGSKVCSVMTYESGSEFGEIGNYTRIGYFSTPLKTYNGTVIGNATTMDNLRVLRETKTATAGYRLYPTTPTITVTQETLNFTGTPSATKTFIAAGFNLAANVTWTKGGTNPTAFNVVASPWIAAQGGRLSVTFTGSTTQDYYATITISSGSLQKIVSLRYLSCTQSLSAVDEKFTDAQYPPDCWISQSASSTPWKRVTTGGSPACSPYSAAGMLQFNSFSYANGSTGLLITPKLATTNNSKLTFYMYRDNGMTGTVDKVNVYLSSTPAISGTPLLTINRPINAAPTVAANGWYPYTVNLPTLSMTNAYVVLEGVSAYGNNIYVDDIKIEALIPELTVNPTTLNFNNVNIGTTSASQNITVSGTNLTGNITFTKGGTNPTLFNVTPASLTTAGGNFGVTFSPTAAGNFSATLTISSAGAANKTVTLSGTCIVPPPVVVTPENVTHNSFTAKWNAVTGATGYLLSVYTKDGRANIFFSDYNDKPVGNVISHTVTGVAPNTTYFYTVKAVAGGAISVASVEVSVTTDAPPHIPVTNITSVPTVVLVGNEFILKDIGVVVPSDASNKTIDWSLSESGTANAGLSFVLVDAILVPRIVPASAGTFKLTATIVNGLTASTNYTQEFIIRASDTIYIVETNPNGVNRFLWSQCSDALTALKDGWTLNLIEAPTNVPSIINPYDKSFTIVGDPAKIYPVVIQCNQNLHLVNFNSNANALNGIFLSPIPNTLTLTVIGDCSITNTNNALQNSGKDIIIEGTGTLTLVGGTNGIDLQGSTLTVNTDVSVTGTNHGLYLQTANTTISGNGSLTATGAGTAGNGIYVVNGNLILEGSITVTAQGAENGKAVLLNGSGRVNFFTLNHKLMLKNIGNNPQEIPCTKTDASLCWSVTGDGVITSGNETSAQMVYMLSGISRGAKSAVIKLAEMPVFCGGDGSPSDPYQICTPKQLDEVRNYLDKHFILKNNIDLAPYLAFGGNGYAQWGADGWMPIGATSTSSANYFHGSFNGNGHKITGLIINRNTQVWTGLFSLLDDDAIIENLGVEDCYVLGSYYTGGLVGQTTNATIKNCYTSGGVQSLEMSVGGLVGGFYDNSTLENSYSSCTVHASGDYVGGLVGESALISGTNCRIKNCYATGNVSSFSGHVGGLEGACFGNLVIENCYATGNVHGTTRIGGLIGYNSGGSTIRYCVAANGSVTATSGSATINRIAGVNSGGTLTNNYALNTMIVQRNGVNVTISPNLNTIDGQNATLTDIKTQTFYTTPANWNSGAGVWNFAGATPDWKMCPLGSYPYLKWQNISSICGGIFTVCFDAGAGTFDTGTVLDPGDCLTEANIGDGITLPVAVPPTVCQPDYVFVGWTTIANYENTTPPTPLYPAGLYNPIDDEMMYAVYSNTTNYATDPDCSTPVIEYSIYLTVTGSGTVTPGNPEIKVREGENQKFTFVPAACYRIAQVVVNGTVSPAAESDGEYTFINVTADCTIDVIFALKTYTVSVSGSTGGTASGGGTINCGTAATVTAYPNPCYRFLNWTANSVVVSTANPYTFTVSRDSTLIANFQYVNYTINATAGTGGTITPSGATIVPCGGNRGFTFAANPGFEIDGLWVNSISVPDSIAGGSYTFRDVTSNQTITVSFKPTVVAICPTQVYDVPNNILYDVVPLAGRCWYKDNVRNTLYQNSAAIPFAKPYYHELYPNTAQNIIDFGLIYTYESVAGGDLCPTGWRLPTAAEWNLLSAFNAFDLMNGDFWLKPNTNTNSTDFDSHGAGIYNDATGTFEKLYGSTMYWSSTTTTSTTICACLNYYCSVFELIEVVKVNGVSVRCIMD